MSDQQSKSDAVESFRLAALEQQIRTLGDENARIRHEVQQHDRRILSAEHIIRSLSEKAQSFVSKDEFTPIRMIVYGLAASALTGLVSAILAKILVK